MIIAELVKNHKIKMGTVEEVLVAFGHNLDGVLAMNEEAWHVYAYLLLHVFPKPMKSGWGWFRVGWTWLGWWKFVEKCVVSGNPSAKAEEERSCFELLNAEAKGEKQDQQVDFRVLFKPSSTQQASALLVVNSDECGTYRAKLAGFVQPPQATGPRPCAQGKPTPIKFRNPPSGAQPTNFTFSVDNPAYELDKKSAQIAPKGEVDINVTYKGGAASGGRVMVKCASVPTPWVFFLEGA